MTRCRNLLALMGVSACLLSASSAGADTLDRIRAEGFFVWGADQEGGGPYVFPDRSAPGGIAGFEVDLASLLASELGRELGRPVEARFLQGQWDTLPDLLLTGRIDMVLNGYEWTRERCELMASTLPYYVFELQLLARRDSIRITGWDAVLAAPHARIGVLGGSAAEAYLRSRPGAERADIVLYDGNTNAMDDVAAGKLDATVQDLPIAIFYGHDFPALALVGGPVGPGRYVIYVGKGDDGLRAALNRAIVSLRLSGALRSLYERYGIWTSAQENPELLALPGESATPGAGPGLWQRHGLLLLQAAGMTVLLSILAMPLAVLAGILIALGRLYGPRPVSFLLALYVEVVRGTPLMLQLFVIFFLLPRMGIVIAAFPAAIAGLAINYAAYEAEIYRAGIQAIPAGQMEAALALGMPRALALRRIILPQAVRIVIPPVTNDFIALFKDTSVCSVITVVELTKRYNISVMSRPADLLPLAAVTALLYLMMSYPLSILASRMERRLRS